MKLENEERGSLVGAFIVVDGDEILSITATGQVVRSPINEDFRPTGRSTQGVNFVTPKKGDTVAVVARSVEAKDPEDEATESLDEGPDATIGGADNATADSTGAAEAGSDRAEAPEPGESES